ncbi:Gfo/Idh/MocA family protein [Carboxylicivirga linearis]|uniref:Gfo/Idh/MocA family oxidoreductase n=1 Tax=Carboxylicivirga linearis TaxID=1628157 RepID=A0ABS5JPY4_9BACT|nr:Gfo/Idh/MocA family oxidoreductase [Carboxylicivirga linearis]MBS2096944.1 Gfo/Idh/MocA family oxidoreductase [Carboxylicivirga linearis]
MQKLKIGVLGASNHFIKRVVLPVMQLDNVELYGIASRSDIKAQEVAKEFSIANHYGSYEALLADSNIDAVYIPLPNHMHAEWIKKSADAGKHILCEKPLCMNTAEAEDVLEYTQRKGVALTEAFMYKFHPQWQFVRDVIRTNNIGKINYIHTSFSYNNPSPNNIRNILEYGGGAIRDIGCYAISVPRFILDKEPDQVVSHVTKHPDFKTDMLSSALLDFGGTRASLHVGTASDGYQKVDIVGTAGNIIVHLPFNTYSDVPAKVTVTTGIGVREVSFDPVDQYGLMFEAFADSIINKKPLPFTTDDAILNQKVMDAVFRSASTKGWELVD